MATIKVEITSREMIKPSSPTPLHLKILRLSFIDQMEPLIHPSLTFFYPNIPSNHNLDHKNGEISTLFKRSLSDTLVYFYPLAGRLDGNISINCNDEGVEFNEAYVSTDLSKVIENPNAHDLSELLPFGPTDRDGIMLGVQLNRFSCGGIAISMCISHKIADAKAFVEFANAWATITRKNELIKRPKFDGSSHFPPRDLKGYALETGIDKGKIVRRRFVFDKNMIEALQKQTVNEINIDCSSSKVIKFSPTRVEVVTAFIWKRVMDASRAKSSPNNATKTYAVVHFVDLRTRMTPPVPEGCFGNISWFTTARCLKGENAKHFELIALSRRAIGKINNQFINKQLKNGEYVSLMKKAAGSSNGKLLENCFISSICRLPIYEVDFGWGKPIWVGQAMMPNKSHVLLSSTSCGTGIEAWVSMASDDHIALLERDHRLLSQIANNGGLSPLVEVCRCAL